MLQEIQTLLKFYMGAKSKAKGKWTESSVEAAQAHGKPAKNATEQLRSCAKEFIADFKVPEWPYDSYNISLIDADEELKQEIALFLQSKGKYVKAADIIQYLKDLNVKAKWGLKNEISLATAKNWMKKASYIWVKKSHGLYFNGHKRDDELNYQQKSSFQFGFISMTRCKNGTMMEQKSCLI